MYYHVWVQDKLDIKALEEVYNTSNAVVRWRGKTPVEMTCRYLGEDTLVKFYTSEQVNRHLKLSLFCGGEYQKVVILDPVNIQPTMYLGSRIRSRDKPNGVGRLSSNSLLEYEISEMGTKVYWKDGRGTLLYITEQHITTEKLHEIIDEAMW
ncbi:hypothetical protein VPBG_00002 [Vibrio phage helene 12B3]|uniref:hypothetical protein n=1 Tax=Vibrio phage helene 12B3 TaxID=573173 RepID=UPI0002C1270D|nr:hypothetical protein VPBG_00002 [Vibrio phage helene 12B3]YP_009222881.1 hypothetical protein VPLG_00032 [Vibrio phage eugene 12A10]AGG57775.1 hypothetical protein VPBG_00002 [Vibrio phage helene 12B3]AGN51471.1 hypothetical protein VPLG_00032 [Vibrio phage eugene 12A10]